MQRGNHTFWMKDYLTDRMQCAQVSPSHQNGKYDGRPPPANFAPSHFRKEGY